MPIKHKVVMGLGFGDEGKGQFTDFLCSLSPHATVVRFNGGHQAGHTVEYNGIRHVFSNFGSGTLRGNPTYWSKECTVDPVGLLNELRVLNRYGINPTLYIDADCPITTPADIMYNQLNNKDGSVGVGFGATIAREEHHYHLQFMDLFYPNIKRDKLSKIKEYYSNISYDIHRFLNDCDALINTEGIELAYGKPSYEESIYEGAQGLLLDQHYGFFPNVTRSNCGTANLPEQEYEYYLVTMAYQTRHGKGFMSDQFCNHINIDDLETNIYNQYQGDFRRGILDLDMIAYAIRKDHKLRSVETRKNLVITCTDHLSLFKFLKGGKIILHDSLREFCQSIIYYLMRSGIYISDLYLSKRENGVIKIWKENNCAD